MEINAEINKVFGEEMAKLFASKISEEEILKEAESVWEDMCSEGGTYWNRSSPEAVKFIKNALNERLTEEIAAITETDKFKAECHTMAEQMVNEIRDETYKKVVEEVSSRLAGMSVGGYGLSLRNMIEQVIMESMGR